MSEKTPTMYIKLMVDMAMAVLFLICLGFRLTAETTHEWAGIALFALFSVHTWFNWRWYGNLFKGTYSFRRVAATIINLCLLGLMVLLLFGGVRNAHLLTFLELNGSMRYREWHTFAAYWILVLAGVHTGMHWTMIAGAMRALTENMCIRSAAVIPLRLVGMALAAFGVWASFDRDMGSKLFLGFGFDYWDPERPAALFYLSTFSVLFLYALSTHGIMRLAARVIGRLASVFRPIPGETSSGLHSAMAAEPRGKSP